MRLLTAQVIVTATRSSLNDVEFLHLDGRDVQQLTEAMFEPRFAVAESEPAARATGTASPLQRTVAY